MKLARVLTIVITVLSLVVASRLELSKDLTTLFPHTKEADTLARVTRAFGGGDVGLVLLTGEDVAAVERATEAVAAELRRCESIAHVMTTLPTPGASPDPTEAWRFAGPTARARLARALTEEGMRSRLRETHALLLAPGASDASELITRDPLRLSLIPWQDQIEVAAGVRGGGDGAFVADGGRARLIALEPRGRAFEPGAAARFTAEAEAAIAKVHGEAPGVKISLTGGHVIARQTEMMMRTDLEKSGVLSIVLASVLFLFTFRRARALVAVLPPLAMGTLWTTAVAALAYPKLSAVATAFAAVVIGVGVDTGVHVYGRLLEARRAGLSPTAAGDLAWRETWRPTLGAAAAAAGAFASLLLSNVEGMKQLGVLCAAGELLTAVAILIVVPVIGAWLERGAPPPASHKTWVSAITKTRGRSIVALAVTGALVIAGVGAGMPRIDHAVVALDAKTLPALAVYESIYSLFGSAKGQILAVSADPEESRARARSDAIAEAADVLLDKHEILGFDALARIAPAPETQRARLRERDALDLPAKRALLERALADEGFSVEAFQPALDAFSHPSTNTGDVLASSDPDRAPMLSWLRRRHLAQDPDGGGFLAVTYVRTPNGAELGDAAVALRAADPGTILTGFADLERGLARTMQEELPRVVLASLAIVVVMLGLSLRRASRVVLAVVVLVIEVAIVLALSKILGVRWHLYDALVLPVLLGITLDEVLFLLEAYGRTRSIEAALVEQAPLGATTALTTAAGFGALVVCRFDGLVDVGKVGALGSTVGLVVSLVVIPSVFRLTNR